LRKKETQKLQNKTKQNRTAGGGGGGETICFGYYSGDKKKHKSMGFIVCTKSFSLENFTPKSCQILRENKS
jgi:hypothetical protein